MSKGYLLESNIQGGNAIAAMETVKIAMKNLSNSLERWLGIELFFSVQRSCDGLHLGNQQCFYICQNGLLLLGTKLKYLKIK